jgi:cell division protein FtsW
MFLCLISVVEVYSATSTLAYKTGIPWEPISRHTVFLLTGIALILIIHNIPYRFFSVLILLLPVSVVLLAATMVSGEEINNSSRWMDIFGIRFQPSEVAKLSLVVFISFMMSRRKLFSEDSIFKYIMIAVGVVCLLILPGNFSTALMLFGVCFLLMFIGQIPFRKLAKWGGGLLAAGLLSVLLLHLLPQGLVEDYLPRLATWQARIERFNEPEEAEEGGKYKITDGNYQVTHAKIAIARGGVFGRMPGNGQQRDFLPQAYSDFIYAVIIEELGIVGGAFVLMLYFILMMRVGVIARQCRKPFAKYLVLGCGLMVVVQALANMAVAVDLIPVTGQTLPLISRGGTSTLTTCMYFGIILSISRFGAGIGQEEEEEEEKDGKEEDTL